MCLLFPLFWPLLPALLIGMACVSLRDAYWRWQARRRRRQGSIKGAGTDEICNG
jgi:hypothetical protein